MPCARGTYPKEVTPLRMPVKYAVASVLAGAANGCFGGGGGMVLLPLLTRWCQCGGKDCLCHLRGGDPALLRGIRRRIPAAHTF